MNNDDIVTVLRQRHANCTGRDPRIIPMVGGTIFLQAADEIERLREELTASHESHGNEVGALTERLSLAIHERDEARREVCILQPFAHHNDGIAKDYAAYRKWDCFKETP